MPMNSSARSPLVFARLHDGAARASGGGNRSCTPRTEPVMGSAPGVDAGNETMTSPLNVVWMASSPRAAEARLQPLGEHHLDLVGRRAGRLDVDLDPFDRLVSGAMQRPLEDDVGGLSLGKPGADHLEPVAHFGFAGGEIEHVEQLGRGLGRDAARPGQAPE